MSYKKALDILPQELIEELQKYIDGEYIYIPRKDCNKKSWGDTTGSKKQTYERNFMIYQNYKRGMSIKDLSEMYYLSPKWIQRIIAKFEINS
ncbi:MAG: hypothetical protein E7208_10050 [Clostridium butyricum]|nr:hypothetical protein [Clostridium butyricum]